MSERPTFVRTGSGYHAAVSDPGSVRIRRGNGDVASVATRCRAAMAHFRFRRLGRRIDALAFTGWHAPARPGRRLGSRVPGAVQAAVALPGLRA